MRSLILVLLILSSFRASSQVEPFKSYNKDQLLRIAAATLKARACDTIIKIQEKEISNRDEIILKDSLEKNHLQSTIVLKDTLYYNQGLEIKSLKTDLTKGKITQFGLLIALAAFVFLK